MRNFIDIVSLPLLEAYYNTYLIDCDDGVRRTVELFRNPSRAELIKMMNQTEYKELRGVLFPETDEMIVWDGTAIQHHDVTGVLDRDDYYIRLFVTSVGIIIHDHPDDSEGGVDYEINAIQQSPAIIRAMGPNVNVSV